MSEADDGQNAPSAHGMGNQALLQVIEGSLTAVRAGLSTINLDPVAGSRIVANHAATLSRAVLAMSGKIDLLAPVEQKAPPQRIDRAMLESG